MNLIFKGEKWKHIDLIYSIYFIYNDNYESLLEEYNLKPNKDISKLIKTLSKFINNDKNFLKLFFNENFIFPTLPCEVDELWNIDSIDEVVDLFLKIDEEKVKRNLMDYLYREIYEPIEKTKNSKKYLSELLVNSDKLFIFIDNLKINVELKWELYHFINHPKKYFKEFAETLSIFIPEFKKFIDKHNDTMEEFNLYVEKNINDKGVEFLKDLTDDYIAFDSYEKIYLTTSLVNSVSTTYHIYGNEVYFFLGIDYEKVLEQLRGSQELDRSLTILKTISDPIKFEILSYLKDTPLFGKEIAKKTNLSKNTVSYHMNCLMSMNLIKLTKEGTKVYYSIKKDTLINSLELMKKYFEDK